jgi:hypothetical protein
MCWAENDKDPFRPHWGGGFGAISHGGIGDAEDKEEYQRKLVDIITTRNEKTHIPRSVHVKNAVSLVEEAPRCM